MGKKKHAEHVNHERWLVSYADLLTLLFAFFVVLFASSVSDKKKTAAMAAAMQSAFSDGGTFDAHSKTPALEPGLGNSQGTPAPLMAPLPSAAESVSATHSAEVATSVQKAIAGDALQAATHVRSTFEGTVISLSDAGLFASGSAELTVTALQLLRKIAAQLPDREMRVEGHTDNQPIHSDRFHSNFELSTARAAAVAEVLMQTGSIAPSHFALAGYGEYRPLASNATATGRAQNRRVDIVVTNEGPATLTGAASNSSTASSNTGRSNAPALVPVTALNATQQRPPTLAQQLASDADRAAAH